MEFDMSKRMPVVFVSHGAPDALLKAPDTVTSWREIAQALPQPVGILVISAHWEARQPSVSLALAPPTIHDFSGFSPELYHMEYLAPGAPALAERVASSLSAIGLKTDFHPSRGLDHGAWVPLKAMYPQANIPVTQLSLTRNMDASANFKLGKALATLRDEGILIIASGAITHNFGWLDWHAAGNQAPLPKANTFSEWVAERLAAKDVPALVNYRLAPYGAESHPTEEHFLPLLVALGAAGEDMPQRYHPSFAYGGLSMDSYLWQNS
jgi:4,5-DOPA dioxygenase extradiol